MKNFLYFLIPFFSVIGVMAIVSNWNYEVAWRLGLSDKPMPYKCDDQIKRWPEFDKQYVVKEFESGRLNDQIEKGWKHKGTGDAIDRMDYVILYYPLDEYTTLESRISGRMFNDDCSDSKWPPEIEVGKHRCIWFLGSHFLDCTDKPYNYLKKHPKEWKLRRV